MIGVDHMNAHQSKTHFEFGASFVWLEDITSEVLYFLMFVSTSNSIEPVPVAQVCPSFMTSG